MSSTKKCMGRLTVKKYVKNDGSCPFDEWRDELSVKDRARLDARISTIERIEGQVPATYLKKLTDAIWEIRAKGSKELRPLCVMLSADVVILVGFSKKKSQLKDNEMKIAERLAKELGNEHGTTKHWAED